MVDKFSKDKRSQIMAAVKSKNTRPEKVVFTYLKMRGVYFQKHYSKVPGNPDIALPSKKLAVFIDGDFWHGNKLEILKDKLSPYWSQKIINNIKRDKANRNLLKETGWEVMRVWEHSLSGDSKQDTLRQIEHFLAGKEVREPHTLKRR